MPNFELTGGLDGVIKKLELEAERVERNGAAAVIAGAEVARAHMRTAIGTGYHTQHLADHIEIGEPKKSASAGYTVEIEPERDKRPRSGKNRKRRNAKYKAKSNRWMTIGYVLEYGRSDTRAKPWMRNTTEDPAVQAATVDAIRKELMKD